MLTVGLVRAAREIDRSRLQHEIMKNFIQRTIILGVLAFFVCGSHLALARTAYGTVIRVTDPSTEDHGTWLYGEWDSIKNHALGSKKVSTQVETPENYQKLDFTSEPSDKPTHIHMHLKNKSQDTYTITSMIEFVGSSVYASIRGGQIALSFLYRVWAWIVDGITYLFALTKSSLLQIWDYVICFARILLGLPWQIVSYLANLFGNVCPYVTDGLKLVYGFITDTFYRTFSAFACMLGTIIGFLSGFVQILIKSVAFLLVRVKEGIVWSTFAVSNACQHLPSLSADFLRSCGSYLQYFFQFVCWEFLYELLTLIKAIGNLTSRISVPFLAGITMTVFTWLVLYSDSQIPGRFPPTPISPKKFKKLSSHSFHSGYVLAIMNGFLVFALALWSSV